MRQRPEGEREFPTEGDTSDTPYICVVQQKSEDLRGLGGESDEIAER